MSTQERIVEAAANDERAAAAKAPPATTNDDDSDAGFADFLKVFVCLDDEATDSADDADEADDGSSDGGLAELTKAMASMEGAAAAGDDDETSEDDEELAAFERALGAVGASQSTPAKKEMEDSSSASDDKSNPSASNAASNIDDDEEFDTFLDLLESSAPLPPSTRTALQTARAANSSDEFNAIWSEVLDGMSAYRKIQLAHTLQLNEDVERMMADPPAWLLEEHPKPSWMGCVRYWLGSATEGEEGKAGETTAMRAVAVEGERIERGGPERA